MNGNELNKYIYHYLTEDMTKSAIMLTGDWGIGKSYYIQNYLKPSLEKEQEVRYQCVVVSLYGLKYTVEISKQIYLKLRLGKIVDWWNLQLIPCINQTLKAIKKDNIDHSKGIRNITKEVVNAGRGITVNTISTGLIKNIGIDLSYSDKNLKDMYTSIDLSGKLIILEDLERSSIDIIEVLGYVNSLVEQDGVKVLLVANEDEILKANKKGVNDEKEKASDQVQQYLYVKEKTISDTIRFTCNITDAIKQIIENFNNPLLTFIAEDDNLYEIYQICEKIGIKNLRTFMFACQKTIDIFNQLKLNFSVDADFIKTMFFGILAFSQKIKSGSKNGWGDNTNLSTELGTEEYPLFYSSYEYIMFHSLDADRIDKEKEALKRFRLYDRSKSQDDKDLRIIYNYWINSENDVLNAVKSVSERLKNEKDISFYEYGRLAVYLIGAKSVLGCNINQAKELLVKNLYNKGEEVHPDNIFTTILSSKEKPEVIDEFNQLKSDMKESLVARDSIIFGFDYNPASITEFSRKVNSSRKMGELISGKAFASRLNPEKIYEMLKKCSAEQIYDFRTALISVYHSTNIGEYLSGDRTNIEKLKMKVEELCEFSEYDKIQKMQMCFFSDNLTEILAKL